ncbi:hypothetical protein [Streptomyces sp. NBC_01594]|uniref:hypothetical protein n=1 Tax=Streptomyces sp. NBC_01594 TaxID=2975890 RepID=UPI00386B4780
MCGSGGRDGRFPLQNPPYGPQSEPHLAQGAREVETGDAMGVMEPIAGFRRVAVRLDRRVALPGMVREK